MRLTVNLDPGHVLRWHVVLVDELTAQGHACEIVFSDSGKALSRTVLGFIKLDRHRYRATDINLAERVDAAAVALSAPDEPHGECQLTIDLTGQPLTNRATSVRTLKPCYDGATDDAFLFHAIVSGNAPHLSLLEEPALQIREIGRPATEDPLHLISSFNQVASRLIEGICQAITIMAAEHSDQNRDSGSRRRTRTVPREQLLQRSAPGSFPAAMAGFAGRRGRRITTNIANQLMRRRQHWQVAWRHIDETTPWPAGPLHLSDYNLLADDGDRFFADPFVFAHNGVRAIFVEDFPTSLDRGIISACVIGDDGAAGPIEPVLDCGSHLSYPQVFARDGEIWMLPESSATGGLDLYRCVRFPDQWCFEQRLIDAPLHDATLFDFDGRMWIAASTVALQSSSWDALSLFSADTLLGPWRPHRDNPVLLDRHSARPGGPLWRDGDRLLRPAQDCGAGYGQRLVINEIDQLSETAFAEHAVGHIEFAQDSGIVGPHTISRSHGLEVIDFYLRRGRPHRR